MVSRDGLDNVANCILYFPSFRTFWNALYCQVKRWVCWQKLTRLCPFRW